MRSCASNLPLGGKWKLGRASERMSESEERRVGDVTGTNVKRKRRLALFHVEQGRARSSSEGMQKKRQLDRSRSVVGDFVYAKKRLMICVARWQNLMARWQNLDCAPRPPPWRNPRIGRDQILQRSVADP